VPTRTETSPESSGENKVVSEIVGAYATVIELGETAAKAVGQAVSHVIKNSGLAAEIAQEAMKEDGDGWVEKGVCASFKVLVVNAAGAPFLNSAARGAVAGAAGGPYGAATGAAVAVVAVAATKPAIQELTRPVGETVDKVCHAGFGWMREKLQQIETKQTPTSITPPSNTSSSALIISNISSSLSGINHADYGAIIGSCVTNIQSVQKSQNAAEVGISFSANKINLPQFSNTDRPTVTYTDIMNRQVALANGPFFFSSFHEPPPPSMSKYQDGFYSSGGDGQQWYCNSFGCFPVNGGSNCADGPKCEMGKR
jgi:hypothetical protein